MAKNTILLILMIFAFTLRFWSLNQNPPSLFADEVDIAYQVKTFKTTGADYYGNKFPIHFHSFSDWRTSLQIYSSVVVSFFTQDDFYIVRLPSVIYSVISVYLIYLITGNLYAPFLLAISPWSIHYGRTGFEVSGMITCLLAAIYFFKNKKFYLFSLFLCLSPYFYSTAKLFIPFVFLTLIYIYRQDFLKITKKSLFLLLTLNFLLLLPLAVDTYLGHAGFRFSYIGIFTMPHREQITDTLRYQDISLSHKDQIGVATPFYSFIIHNKYQLVASKFIENYLGSFSPTFLFETGDSNIRHGFGNHGLLYIIDFFTLFIGIFIYIKKPDKIGRVFFILLLLAPIPFALTRDSIGPHATRLILMLPSIIYFTSLGLKKYKFLIAIYLVLFLGFWHYYTVHYPQESAATWHYNLANSVIAAKEYPSNQIYFSNKYEPFLPFFLNYWPYLSPLKLNNTDLNYFDGQSLDNRYFFGNINWNSANLFPDHSLIVVPEMEIKQIPPTFKLVKKINKTYEMAQSFYLYTQNEK